MSPVWITDYLYLNRQGFTAQWKRRQFPDCCITQCFQSRYRCECAQYTVKSQLDKTAIGIRKEGRWGLVQMDAETAGVRYTFFVFKGGIILWKKAFCVLAYWCVHEEFPVICNVLLHGHMFGSFTRKFGVFRSTLVFVIIPHCTTILV